MALTQTLARLAAFQSSDAPVVSLYLNAQPGGQGRDYFQPFIRKQFNETLKTFELRTPAYASFERDVERINEWLIEQLDPAANGIAIYACAGADDFWEAVQFDVPIPNNRLYVNDRPQLYQLARVIDQYPRYVAVVLDSYQARLFVFNLGQIEDTEQLEGVKTGRTDVGGWSQARYERHNENLHLHHIKDVVEALDQAVRMYNVDQIVIGCNETTLPLLREQLPERLQQQVAAMLTMDINTPDHEVAATTLDAMRQHDNERDAAKVQQVRDLRNPTGGGMATTGVADTLAALNNGQVNELILSASRDAINPDEQEVQQTVAAYRPAADTADQLADHESIINELIIKAVQTGATITFIEDTTLLDEFEGVGALLRYAITQGGPDEQV